MVRVHVLCVVSFSAYLIAVQLFVDRPDIKAGVCLGAATPEMYANTGVAC